GAEEDRQPEEDQHAGSRRPTRVDPARDGAGQTGAYWKRAARVARSSGGDTRMGFLVRVLVNALAIWVATEVVPGIQARSATTVIAAALVLGLLNAIVRPVLLVLTLPLTLLTLGLFLFVLNALCLWLTSAVVPGFRVRGFWPAFWGALIISALSWAVNGFISDRGRLVVIGRRWPPASGRWHLP